MCIELFPEQENEDVNPKIVAGVYHIKLPTLYNKISRGDSDLPPSYLLRGKRFFPVHEFRQWLISRNLDSLLSKENNSIMSGSVGVKYTAERLNISPKTLYNIISKGSTDLPPSYVISRKRLFPKYELEQWLHARKQKAQLSFEFDFQHKEADHE
jgi:predicted DNA-binding transcriptional regulator AlpA